MHASRSLIFFAELFNQAAGHEVLEFFVSAQAKHFFATAYGVSQFKVLKHSFEEIVESEYFFFRKDIAEFIGHVVWKSPGKPGSFSWCWHNRMIIA